MTPHGLKVLKALIAEDCPYDPTYFHMRTIADAAGFDRAKTRRIVRYLARKGYAEYGKGLWTDSGEVAGAGYCITKAGLELLAELEPA
jgi:hypothetical protein